MFHLGFVWSSTTLYENPGIKKYLCTYCSYNTANKFDLKKHILTHTGERPFGCDICGRRFARKDNMKKHISGKHSKS